MQRSKNFGGFLGAAFDLIGKNWLAILIYAVVVGGMSAAGVIIGLIDVEDNIGGFNLGFAIEQGQGLAAAGFILGSAIIAFVGSYFLLAQFLKSENRLRTSDTRIWAYFLITILSVLGLIAGLLLLVIPGIILMVRWSASSGYLIGRGDGVVDSLKASWDATRGYSWPIFFAGLVYALLIGIVFAMISGVSIFAGTLTVTAIVSGVGDAASNALYYAFGIGVYTVLNDVSEETAEVFA